ncbi:hypothetical protein Tco_0307701 [Tanacetum coccineum]
MESNEKQQLFAQTVQQQNTTLTSQLELYKERVRVFENIKGDNNYLNEFLEADRKAKHFNQQAQSKFIRDQDIIRDLKQQRDKLDLAVIDYKRQKEEYQKTQTIFNQTQRDKEEKYLNDILQLQAKNKDLENVVCKMGKSTETLRKLNKLYDNFVPQKELSAKQTYFPSSFISSEKVSSEIKPSMASMPSANPMLVDLNEMENVFKKLFELLEKNCKRASIFYTSPEELQLNDNRFKRDVKEMKDVFISVENDLDETFKQNELLKDRLLEASLAEDIKNLVITSCMEIRNKDLHDETERISKESKDVSNESKTTDTVCNDAFEVTQELSKRIVELEKDLSKFETKSIAFEIALQHKSREINSLKTLQKNKNFMASLQIENAHLKQTYKDLFDSVQRSRVETNHCDEVKVKNVFADEEKRATLGKLNAFDNENYDFESKVIHLEKIIAQKSKDFDDVNLELSNRTAKFEAYFEKLEKRKLTQLENLKGKRVETKIDNSSILGKPPLLNNERDQLLKQIASLESKLASQDIRSCQKDYHELRTSYNALKVKFDSLNRKKWNINVSKYSKPKESVSEKGFKTRPLNAKNQSFETSYSCFTPVKQVWRPIKESQTFEASTSQKSFKTSTLKGKNQVFVTPHSRFTPVKQVWRPKQSHSKSFKYSKSEMLSMQNKNDSASTINKKGRFSNDAKTNFRNVSSNDNNKWKSSSSTRFKTLHETPSFNNQWKIKRNFKSPLVPRELFSNETPVSSSRWNSTSLHRIDTTLKWFSKLGRPVSTVLKWVPKVVV